MLLKTVIATNGLPSLLICAQTSGNAHVGDDYEFNALADGKTFKAVRVDDRTIQFVAQQPEPTENENGLPSVLPVTKNYDRMNTPDLATLAVQRGLNPYLEDGGRNQHLAEKATIVKMLRRSDQEQAQGKLANVK